MKGLNSLLTFACAALGACAGAVKTSQPVIDELGCAVPPPAVFRKIGTSAELVKAKVGGVDVEGGKFSLTSDVVALVSQAALDETASRYLDCRAINGFAPEAAQWVTALVFFSKTRPTAEQMSAWQREHPSPAELRLRRSDQPPGNTAMETRSDSGPMNLSAPVRASDPLTPVLPSLGPVGACVVPYNAPSSGNVIYSSSAVSQRVGKLTFSLESVEDVGSNEVRVVLAIVSSGDPGAVAFRKAATSGRAMDSPRARIELAGDPGSSFTLRSSADLAFGTSAEDWLIIPACETRSVVLAFSGQVPAMAARPFSLSANTWLATLEGNGSVKTQPLTVFVRK